jgi:hypothetical protein
MDVQIFFNELLIRDRMVRGDGLPSRIQIHALLPTLDQGDLKIL